MRIDAARVHVAPLRLRRPFRTAAGETHDRPTILLELDAGDLTGVAECPALPVATHGADDHATALAALREALVPALVPWGRAPGEPSLAALRGLAPDAPMAVSAALMALEDLEARAAGLPLAEWLVRQPEGPAADAGGARTPRAGAEARAVIGLAERADDAVRAATELVEAGYRRLKLKVSPEAGLDGARAVRKAFPGVPLAVDANGSFAAPASGGAAAAAARLAELDALGLEFIEQPLAPADLAGHAQLRRELRTPIGLDESAVGHAAARRAIEAGACDALNVRPALCGGHREALRILAACRDAGVRAWCGGYLEAGVGRAHAIAFARHPALTLGADLSASERYWERDVASPAASLNADGLLVGPAGAGCGVDATLPRPRRRPRNGA
ncbi:MAG: enolase C-terminal domain-like protein [Gemmatimonadota bacterium]